MPISTSISLLEKTFTNKNSSLLDFVTFARAGCLIALVQNIGEESPGNFRNRTLRISGVLPVNVSNRKCHRKM